MLASTLALATLALSGSAFASIDYGPSSLSTSSPSSSELELTPSSRSSRPRSHADHDSGRLAAVDSSSRHDLDSEIAYKELCYRNLYADVGASLSLSLVLDRRSGRSGS